MDGAAGLGAAASAGAGAALPTRGAAPRHWPPQSLHPTPSTCPNGSSAPGNRLPAPGRSGSGGPYLSYGAGRRRFCGAATGGAAVPPAGSALAAPAALVTAGRPAPPAATPACWLGELSISRVGPRRGGEVGYWEGTGMLGGKRGLGY